jgi:hypothetical protein
MSDASLARVNWANERDPAHLRRLKCAQDVQKIDFLHAGYAVDLLHDKQAKPLEGI